MRRAVLVLAGPAFVLALWWLAGRGEVLRPRASDPVRLVWIVRSPEQSAPGAPARPNGEITARSAPSPAPRARAAVVALMRPGAALDFGNMAVAGEPCIEPSARAGAGDERVAYLRSLRRLVEQRMRDMGVWHRGAGAAAATATLRLWIGPDGRLARSAVQAVPGSGLDTALARLVAPPIALPRPPAGLAQPIDIDLSDVALSIPPFDHAEDGAAAR